MLPSATLPKIECKDTSLYKKQKQEFFPAFLLRISHYICHIRSEPMNEITVIQNKIYETIAALSVKIPKAQQLHRKIRYKFEVNPHCGIQK